ncbi:hypothetical protein BX666DRAFT_2032637 [Dichotomocladium elegans]|nr:hypothetical protein BX666DRAFT_2032637 [Dichotomocladium elegans]
MKAVHIGFIHNRFNEQYVLDLQGHLPMQDFRSAMHQINSAIDRNTPPSESMDWLSASWILITMGIYGLSWLLGSSYVLLSIPFAYAFSGIIYLWARRRKYAKFEQAVVGACQKLNTRRDMRGVYFRFGLRQGRKTTTFWWNRYGLIRVPVYVLIIEFDEKRFIVNQQSTAFSFHQPVTHQVPDYVSIPLLYADTHSAINMPAAAHFVASKNGGDER